MQKGSQTVLFNIEKLINLQKETITVLIKIQKILLYFQKVHIDSEKLMNLQTVLKNNEN